MRMSIRLCVALIWFSMLALIQGAGAPASLAAPPSGPLIPPEMEGNPRLQQLWADMMMRAGEYGDHIALGNDLPTYSRTWLDDQVTAYYNTVMPTLDHLTSPAPVTGYPSADDLALTTRPFRRSVLDTATRVLALESAQAVSVWKEEQQLKLMQESCDQARGSLVALISAGQDRARRSARDPRNLEEMDRFIHGTDVQGGNDGAEYLPSLYNINAPLYFSPEWKTVVRSWEQASAVIRTYDFDHSSERSATEARAYDDIINSHVRRQRRGQVEFLNSNMGRAERYLQTFLDDQADELLPNNLKPLSQRFQKLGGASGVAAGRLRPFWQERAQQAVQKSVDLRARLSAEKDFLSSERTNLDAERSQLVSTGEVLASRSVVDAVTKTDIDRVAADLTSRGHDLTVIEIPAAQAAETLLASKNEELVQARTALLTYAFSCPFGDTSPELCTHPNVKRAYIDESRNRQKNYESVQKAAQNTRAESLSRRQRITTLRNALLSDKAAYRVRLNDWQSMTLELRNSIRAQRASLLKNQSASGLNRSEITANDQNLSELNRAVADISF